MTPHEKMLAMFDMQQKLNDETNGPGWEMGVSPKNGKKIDWTRCIWLECAEAVKSYSWKHWKDVSKPANMANIRVEAVDAWHFVMSEVLASRGDNTIEEILERSAELKNFEQPRKSKFYSDEDQIKAFELMTVTAMTRGKYAIMGAFFFICVRINMSLDELYETYMVKHLLNGLRQELGYQEGTYKKQLTMTGIFDTPVEDNIIMFTIFRDNKKSSLEEIREKFLAVYNENVDIPASE